MGWPSVPLGQVVTPTDRAEQPLPGIKIRQLGVRLWGQGAYERETIDGSDTKYKILSRVEANDVVVNKIWARNGSVAVVPSNLAGCYVSGEFPTFIPNLDVIDARWLHWLTKTQSFWGQCNEKSRGTSGQNRIKPTEFLTITIPLPPLIEQRRIVGRIEELAGKIEEARALRRAAMEETKSLMIAEARRTFSDVDAPTTELGAWLDLSRSGIQTGPFGAQLSANDFADSGVPVLTIGNVQFNGLRLDNLRYVSEGKAAELSRFKIQTGDLLFARMGTIGRCCLVPSTAQGWLINYHIIRVALAKDRIDPRYIFWLLRASPDVEMYLAEKIRGATREGVNSSIVGGLPCRVPSLETQQNVATHLDGVEQKLLNLEEVQTFIAIELDALLPSILDRAFRGAL